MATLATLPAWLPTALTIASTAVGAAGTIAAGQAAKRNSDFQAAQLDVRARQEKAAAQREAEDIRRRTQLALSRQQAVSAASGLGASDPTVQEIASETASFGAYQAATAQAGGDMRASNAYLQASGARASGSAALTGSYLSAGSTILGSVASNVFQDKYGFAGGMGDPVTGDWRYSTSAQPVGGYG